MTQHILTLNNFLQSPIEALLDSIRSLRKAVEHRRKINSTIKELNALTDRELNDIGLSRGDIWAVAHDDTSFKRVAADKNSNLDGWV